MWCVTICKGDYRMPVIFTSYNDASDLIMSVLSSDEHKEIKVVVTTVEATDGITL